jgi:hypothetical protein
MVTYITLLDEVLGHFRKLKAVCDVIATQYGWHGVLSTWLAWRCDLTFHLKCVSGQWGW